MEENRAYEELKRRLIEGQLDESEYGVVPISMLGLSVKTQNMLCRNGCCTLATVPKSIRELKKLRGCGEWTAYEIASTLKAIGVRLG